MRVVCEAASRFSHQHGTNIRGDSPPTRAQLCRTHTMHKRLLLGEHRLPLQLNLRSSLRLSMPLQEQNPTSHACAAKSVVAGERRVDNLISACCSQNYQRQLLEEVISGQRRAARRSGCGEQGLHAHTAVHRRHLVLPPCLAPSPFAFYVLSQLSSSVLLRPSLGHQRGSAGSSFAAGRADGWQRLSWVLGEQDTT